MSKLNAEWIPYMKAYRLYDPRHPQQTVAYEEDEVVAEARCVRKGRVTPACGTVEIPP